METDEALRGILMYFILPLWLAAGFSDYLCHRAAQIEKTSGWKESLLHLLQFGEMAIPVGLAAAACGESVTFFRDSRLRK